MNNEYCIAVDAPTNWPTLGYFSSIIATPQHPLVEMAIPMGTITQENPLGGVDITKCVTDHRDTHKICNKRCHSS